jgi:molybdate transport system ATP-binding protein
MNIDVDVALTQGNFHLAVRFGSDARTIGLTGPSGSGKTTLLNVIAGTLRPGRGHVRIDGRVFADSKRHVMVPPHRREVGYVFQDGRLFPHLTVWQNLRYGRWFSGGRTLPVGVERIIELLGIGHLLDRRAVGLSGGEQQRVAIGRALFAAPRLLLMDEPLAGLDRQRRLEVLPLIARVRDEARIPLIYVSHAEDEILRLTNEVVTLNEGRQIAAPTRSSQEPRMAPGDGDPKRAL